MLSIFALIINSPWYLAEHIEKITGHYPQWIVDVFGGINSNLLDAYEGFGALLYKLFWS